MSEATTTQRTGHVKVVEQRLHDLPARRVQSDTPPTGKYPGNGGEWAQALLAYQHLLVTEINALSSKDRAMGMGKGLEDDLACVQQAMAWYHQEEMLLSVMVDNARRAALHLIASKLRLQHPHNIVSACMSQGTPHALPS